MFTYRNLPSSSLSDAPGPTMETAIVTLVPVNNHLDLRRIIITRGKPCRIGRASRSEVKNLSANSFNALFDCAVISRDHAKLELGRDNEITITDTSSMHGTRVNGTRMEPRKPWTLKSGDELYLGDRVTRGADTHEGVVLVFRCDQLPSCPKAHIAKVSPQSVSSRGYKVPEVSEDNSEEPYDEFDDDLDVSDDEQLISSAKTTPEDSPSRPGSGKRPIDLESGERNSQNMCVDADDQPVAANSVALSRELPCPLGQNGFSLKPFAKSHSSVEDSVANNASVLVPASLDLDNVRYPRGTPQANLYTQALPEQQSLEFQSHSYSGPHNNSDPASRLQNVYTYVPQHVPQQGRKLWFGHTDLGSSSRWDVPPTSDARAAVFSAVPGGNPRYHQTPDASFGSQCPSFETDKYSTVLEASESLATSQTTSKNKLSIRNIVEPECSSRSYEPLAQFVVAKSSPATGSKRKARELEENDFSQNLNQVAICSTSADATAELAVEDVPKPLPARIEVANAVANHATSLPPTKRRKTSKAKERSTAAELAKLTGAVVVGSVGTIAFLLSPLAEKALQWLS